MKTVFVVSNGELCESGHVVSICSSKKKAIKIALNIPTCFKGGWVPDGDDVWINGCDFISVEERQIDK